MARLIPPNDGVRGIDVKTPTGRRSYNVDRQGGVTVEKPSDVAQMKAEGFREASAFGVSAGRGFPCEACGFSSWFKTCSRCGADNG